MPALLDASVVCSAGAGGVMKLLMSFCTYQTALCGSYGTQSLRETSGPNNFRLPRTCSLNPGGCQAKILTLTVPERRVASLELPRLHLGNPRNAFPDSWGTGRRNPLGLAKNIPLVARECLGPSQYGKNSIISLQRRRQAFNNTWTDS